MALVFLAVVFQSAYCEGAGPFISEDLVRSYVSKFNAHDEELYRNAIPNSEAAEFLVANIPRFECPSKQLEEIYYFRWWTFRKHISLTPEGYVIVEFVTHVPWSLKYNTINAAAMHQTSDGRWLRNKTFMYEYMRFWLKGGGGVRQYNC
jgi:hypothetical protein